MSGCWELSSKRVLAAVLHVDNTTIAWAFGLRGLQIPGPIIGLSGMPFDQARNTACMRALEYGADFIYFIDSDVVPPFDTVYRLMKHNKAIVSGVYSRRSPPHAIPVMIRNGQWVTEYPKNSLIEVDYVGAGCLLISTDHLRRMKPLDPGRQWFSWRVDQKGILPEGECLSEDFTFCRASKLQLGESTWVDTSIQCKHIGYAQATHGKFEPLEVQAV